MSDWRKRLYGESSEFKDFAIKPPDDRKMVVVPEWVGVTSGIDYMQCLADDAAGFDVVFSDTEFKRMRAGLQSIEPSKHSGAIYPHSIYAAYHLFYRHRIIALPEEIIDRLLFEWCDHTMFVPLFKEAVTQNILVITFHRVAIAALSDDRGYNKLDASALENVVSVIGRHSLTEYANSLEALCANSPIHDIIMGRLGYFAYWKWFQTNNQTHDYWSNGAKNLLESR